MTDTKPRTSGEPFEGSYLIDEELRTILERCAAALRSGKFSLLRQVATQVAVQEMTAAQFQVLSVLDRSPTVVAMPIDHGPDVIKALDLLVGVVDLSHVDAGLAITNASLLRARLTSAIAAGTQSAETRSKAPCESKGSAVGNAETPETPHGIR